MFSQDRSQMRRVFHQAWRKRREKQPLEPMEALICDILELHPEYHPIVESIDDNLDRDWLPDQGETNPFLHMSMHIAIREQVLADRPAGIKALYKQVCDKKRDVHEAEHALMECLGEALWKAQSSGLPPDEAGYLDCIRRLT